MNKIITMLWGVVMVLGLNGCVGISQNSDKNGDEINKVNGVGKENNDKTVTKKVGKMNTENNKDKQTQEDELPKGNFTFDEKTGTYYGEVFVKGYFTTEETPEPWCEGEDCGINTSVYLNVIKVNNKAFSDFLKINNGNAFVSGAKISLGCLGRGKISLTNDSDKYGMKDFSIDTTMTKKLLKSTKESPVIIKLTKYKLTGGMGAPACYSYIAKFELAE